MVMVTFPRFMSFTRYGKSTRVSEREEEGMKSTAEHFLGSILRFVSACHSPLNFMQFYAMRAPVGSLFLFLRIIDMHFVLVDSSPRCAKLRSPRIYNHHVR